MACRLSYTILNNFAESELNYVNKGLSLCRLSGGLTPLFNRL